MAFTYSSSTTALRVKLEATLVKRSGPLTDLRFRMKK
jgi:hypothetical protein